MIRTLRRGFLLALAVIAPLSAADGPSASPAPSPAPLAVPPRLPAVGRAQLRDTLNGAPARPDIGPLASFLGAEALFAFNSYLASIAPRIYGGAGLVLLPAGVAGMGPGPERTTAVVLVEGLALYDLLGVDPHRQSEGQIFRANLAAWNGILIANAAAHGFFERRAARRRKIVVLPIRGGAALCAAGRFGKGGDDR